MRKTRVYIDRFNLYHGIIERNRLHWLDLSKFSAKLNDGLPVDKVIYCTALVSSSPIDPNKANRQEGYLRALSVFCPNVEIIKGQFTTHKKPRPLVGCLSMPPCFVDVVVTTEKGSDVNLASRLLHDAHLGNFDRAVVVSGDSDLAEPIRLVVSELKKEVVVRNPRHVFSQELKAVASSYLWIKTATLKDSQLPDPVTSGAHVYHKPKEWSIPKKKCTKSTVISVPCTLGGCTKILETYRYI